MSGKKSGFTLLEVLLAIILLALGLVALLEAMATGLFAGGTNESLLTAVNLAQEKIEMIRNEPYADVITESKGDVTGFADFQRDVTVATVRTGLKQVTVKVYWYVKGQEASTSLDTYVSSI